MRLFASTAFASVAAVVALLASQVSAVASGTKSSSSLMDTKAIMALQRQSTFSQGNPQRIICQINKDRQARYLSPLFLHSTLSQVAQLIGIKYADGTLDQAYFNQLYASKLQPLGNQVTTNYQVLGTYSTDSDYVDAIEKAIYSKLFARNLDAVGVYQDKGIYTVVLASGLAQKPSTVETCPTSGTQYTPPDSNSSGDIVNGIDLAKFLCSLNRERARVRAPTFIVHRALANEALEQARMMDSLGYYTADGPRAVDTSIYSQRVNVKQLYWMAGDKYKSAEGQILDFNLNTPIGSGGNIIAPICKYPTPWSQPTETWTAGQSVTVSFVPWGATHGGGHCEFSISYDGGKTFVVVYQVLRTCFFTGIPAAGGMDTVRDYTFTLPANLPGASNAIFAWTWVNAVGNREFYNNCGDIAIKGPAGSYTGKRMTIANYGPGYPVIPEFIGNYNMGIQYYTTNAEQVTVTGNGYTGDTPASTSSVISLSTIVTSDSSTSQTKETTALLTSS
ncbi:hypothetical protein GGI07_005730, partial [Coemansia sp. Benny D115]